MEKMTKIQKILKEEISKRNTSALALSKDAGLGETYIKDILNGKSTSPRLDKLAILANFLERPLSDFSDDEDGAPRFQKKELKEELLVECFQMIEKQAKNLGLKPGFVKAGRMAIRLYKIAEGENDHVSSFAAQQIIKEEGYLNE